MYIHVCVVKIQCSNYREIFMEKHWRSVVSRSVCDYFFDAQSKASSMTDVPPVITTPHYYLITIYRNNLYFVAVLQNEGRREGGRERGGGREWRKGEGERGRERIRRGGREEGRRRGREREGEKWRERGKNEF